ncbi:MAG: hypothetical protein HOQ09_11210 [Gemmatimonadaceae bacterium]|nr:hypothetical protein [Gemmatimonadaceae bacterium]
MAPSTAPASPRTRAGVRLACAALVSLLTVAACKGADSDGPDIRGSGLRPASVDAAQRAAAYDAALRQAFDVDSTLVLLVDPAILPRNGSFARDAKLGDDVTRALVGRGMVRGSCEPTNVDGQHVPRCASPAPGYVVRFSDLYQMQGDTVRLFLAADRFQTASGVGPATRFAFESGFEVVKRGDAWRVAREGRRIAK